MNILTDEEISKLIYAKNGRIRDHEDFARVVEGAMLKKLAKLAVQDVVPYAWDSESMGLVFENHYSNPEPLHTQDQLIAAQQRTAEACAKLCGEIISPSKPLSDNPCQAWMAGTLQCAEAIRNGEWRNYK